MGAETMAKFFVGGLYSVFPLGQRGMVATASFFVLHSFWISQPGRFPFWGRTNHLRCHARGLSTLPMLTVVPRRILVLWSTFLLIALLLLGLLRFPPLSRLRVT